MAITDIADIHDLVEYLSEKSPKERDLTSKNLLLGFAIRLVPSFWSNVPSKYVDYRTNYWALVGLQALVWSLASFNNRPLASHQPLNWNGVYDSVDAVNEVSASFGNGGPYDVAHEFGLTADALLFAGRAIDVSFDDLENLLDPISMVPGALDWLWEGVREDLRHEYRDQTYQSAELPPRRFGPQTIDSWRLVKDRLQIHPSVDWSFWIEFIDRVLARKRLHEVRIMRVFFGLVRNRLEQRPGPH